MVRTMQEEADREAAARRSERGFFERMGIRRTNETGMEPGTIEHRRNYLGSGATDTNTSYNKKGGTHIRKLLWQPSPRPSTGAWS